MNLFKLIGANVYWLRKAAGLSQDAVAARMGVDRAHFGRIENGQQNITFDTFDRLYKALGVRPADLFQEGRPPKPMRAAAGSSVRAKRQAAKSSP